MRIQNDKYTIEIIPTGIKLGELIDVNPGDPPAGHIFDQTNFNFGGIGHYLWNGGHDTIPLQWLRQTTSCNGSTTGISGFGGYFVKSENGATVTGSLYIGLAIPPVSDVFPNDLNQWEIVAQLQPSQIPANEITWVSIWINDPNNYIYLDNLHMIAVTDALYNENAMWAWGCSSDNVYSGGKAQMVQAPGPTGFPWPWADSLAQIIPPVFTDYIFFNTISQPLNGDIYLAEALTCDWVNGWQDHGPQVNTFDEGDTVHVYLEWGPDTHNFNGDTIGFKWYHNGSKVWEETYSITDDWYGCYWHLYWAISAGTGYIEAYWNNQYLGKTNTYTVLGPDVTADIIEGQSTFYTTHDRYQRPFEPGKTGLIISDARIKNTGTQYGNIHWRIYEHPNTPNENLLSDMFIGFDAGEERTIDAATGENGVLPVPNNPGGTWPLGIKVWGEGEDEPSW